MISARSFLANRIGLGRAVRSLASLVVLAALASAILLWTFEPERCDYATGGEDGASGYALKDETALTQLIDDYQNGVITRAAFRAAIAAVRDTGLPADLRCDFGRTMVLKARPEPYRIRADLAVRSGAILVVEAGATIVLARDVELTVAGRLYAVGAEGSPIRMHAEAEERFGEIRLESGPNQIVWTELTRGRRLLVVTHRPTTRTLVERVRFDGWSELAIELQNSGGLHVANSQFGLETAQTDQSAQAIKSYGSAETLIETSVFGPRRGDNDVVELSDCVAGSWPVVLNNRFAGGEDDAIDLDECAAFVVGNRIRNFRPDTAESKRRGANGGGIAGKGTGSRPVIINNVIDNSYHAIGFKDGARPVIVNNTITRNTIGVTLYKSADDAPEPSAVMINNVLWNNRANGAPQDIVLHGRWWPSYSQRDGDQARLVARYNITASQPDAWDGTKNSNADPLLDFVAGVPIPEIGSPAIDSGLGTLVFEDAPTRRITDFLESDFCGNRRRQSESRFVAIDRGAVETGQNASGAHPCPRIMVDRAGARE